MRRLSRGVVIGVATVAVVLPAVQASAASRPSNTVAPAISGQPVQGQTLTGTTGTWTGTTPITYSLQWIRCNAGTGKCSNISGATTSTYLLVVADVGFKMKLTVTAANSAGSRSASSAQTPKVTATPLNTSIPTISGTAQDGSTLTAATGTWIGPAPITFTYQWQRCVVSGSCASISGATASTYVARSADVGQQLLVAVKGTNSAGSSTASSARTATVLPAAPVNTAAPTISGTVVDGATLTGSAGTWSGGTPITYAYQWQTCVVGGTCTDLAGATTSTYTARSADVGKQLLVVVKATNAGGAATASSTRTAAVGSAAPVNTAAPTISGTARDSEKLSASVGTWTGTPTITYGYQWRNCGSDDVCVDIAGANESTYLLTDADVGDTIVVQITGSNGGGSSTASSLPTGPVAPVAPADLTPPGISGAAQAGSSLSASSGTWSGTAPVAYAYQWLRCDSSGAGCADISNAAASTYVVRPADIGDTLRVRVTATNTAGHAAASSDRTAVVLPVGNPPQVTTAPSITGTGQDGSSLTADPGSWTGDPPITYAYQWQDCDSAGLKCANIAGATDWVYAPTSTDVGLYVVVQVTATNNGGSSVATSDPVGPITATPPTNDPSDPPAITGTPQDGSTLSASTGTWSGTPTITFRYQWRDCGDGGQNCVDIPGATIATYQLTGSDIGSTVVVRVTATNAAGDVSRAAAATDVVVAAIPFASTGPSISGSAQDGSTLTALAGTWTGTVPITFTYQWQRCDTTCADIVGATDTAYPVTSDDVGHTLTVLVTATNQAGFSTLAAPRTKPVDGTGPVNQTAPAITGTAQVGRTLSASSGSWNGTRPMTFAYLWLQCNSTGSACVAETQTATSSTYLVKTYDKDATLAVQVTATNVAGNGSATSNSTARVTASATAVTTAFWHMEDSGNGMLDSSGYANNGSLTSVSTGQVGSTGNGFGFFASPSRAAVGTSPSLDPGTTQMTVTLHVKFANAPSAAVGDYDLIRKGLSTTSGGDWKVEILQSGQASCTGVGFSGSRTLTAGPNLADNQWHTIVCIETTNTLNIVVDGTKVGTLTASIGKISNTDPLTVAAKISDGDQYTGVLDEVSIAMG